MRLTAIIFALLLAGCASVSTIRDVDGEDMWYREKAAWSVGRRLYIEVEQEPGFNLARITPTVYNGDIYLGQVRISSGGGGTEVLEVDLAAADLPDDWEQHVYWIAEGAWDSPWQVLIHRGPLPQRVGRLRMHVEKRADSRPTPDR